MRKKRQKHIAHEFNGSCFWIGYMCPSHKFVQEEEQEKNYIILSKMISNDNYYLLLINEDTNEICIAKLVYISGWVQITKLSSKKVLENKSTFKNWLKDINHEADRYKYMIKYVLTEDGKIELRNTDYREGHNEPCVSIRFKRVWKCFQY